MGDLALKILIDGEQAQSSPWSIARPGFSLRAVAPCGMADSFSLPQPTAARRLACARCGTAFDCSLGGGCWCADEPYRLPLPDRTAQDCLCPQCLRKLAASAGATPGPAR
jgi:hypothetical protein